MTHKEYQIRKRTFGSEKVDFAVYARTVCGDIHTPWWLVSSREDLEGAHALRLQLIDMEVVAEEVVE